MALSLPIRFGLRSKLFLLSTFLFSIPWFGYQYVWEMEKYLRYGQEQTLVGTARALATTLHDRPNLFNSHASFLPSVEQGRDLYGYQLKNPIRLDGQYRDWPNFTSRAHEYGQDHLLYRQEANATGKALTMEFKTTLGKYDKYLYLFFSVTDDKLVFRDKNMININRNDHLELAFVDQAGKFSRYLISNKKPGWLDTYRITDLENNIPVVTPQIQGQWLTTPQGYNIELRVPLSMVGDKIAFAVHDVDQAQGKVSHTVGSADPRFAKTLGTVLVPSPEIERIVRSMRYTNSSIWVVDQHHRVLATAGDIRQAAGVWHKKSANSESTSWWRGLEQKWLIPLYYMVLTRPPSDFIDQLYDASNLTGKHIVGALKGAATSQWRLTQDQQAVILSAAYPIFINNQVQGAVIVEETTNGIRTLRNRALEKLFSSILAIMLLGAVAFFLFASRISSRIRTLRNQAEQAIDEHGRIKQALPPSSTNDEIGDLSRSFTTAVNRLSQYNHYLENMSSRLSHELRTPIAVVRTSLENLSMQTMPESASAYIDRAQSGITRLNLILTNMSEATRIEQMLHTTDKMDFDFIQVLKGCVQGYQQIYPNISFAIDVDEQLETVNFLGSPEHIAQLLDKVVANAVEFTQDKSVKLAICEEKSQLLLTISNNGELLPEQMQGRLFDSMVSVRSSKRQEQPHLGLGLYIARLICEFHQGKISASNHHQPDGVTVTISLPLGSKS
ncbi:proteobacterial dedicated sortase system histidine kinase [Thalassomonas haliotis]|uniref:histidine kinase n=1 Tax=Thalassomonas haliotis TaxID=485448 RepID=A0ABY7VNC3_9GAMM|nr:proteobacterial dedicated sortase system histidine kinase [Thalassomonas haliotis]WDE14007.1 proteobacterial dedicated sortase system histidine kinase [Thalassomonas haliotis]